MKALCQIVVCAALLSLSFAGGTYAQGTKAKRRPRVIQLEEIVIEGRVQKPNAFYILNRSSLGYEVMDLRNSFVHEVIRSVQKEPF